MKRFDVLGPLGLVALWLGCAGALEEPERFATASDLASSCSAKEVLKTSCAGSGCHGSESPAGGLDLVSEGVEARLVNQPAKLCAPDLLIDPANPDVSLLLRKVDPNAQSCGLKMPMGKPALSTAELSCLAQWVRDTAGATP
jgi:hypothetical protein